MQQVPVLDNGVEKLVGNLRYVSSCNAMQCFFFFSFFLLYQDIL